MIKHCIFTFFFLVQSVMAPVANAGVVTDAPTDPVVVDEPMDTEVVSGNPTAEPAASPAPAAAAPAPVAAPPEVVAPASTTEIQTDYYTEPQSVTEAVAPCAPCENPDPLVQGKSGLNSIDVNGNKTKSEGDGFGSAILWGLGGLALGALGGYYFGKKAGVRSQQQKYQDQYNQNYGSWVYRSPGQFVPPRMISGSSDMFGPHGLQPIQGVNYGPIGNSLGWNNNGGIWNNGGSGWNSGGGGWNSGGGGWNSGGGGWNSGGGGWNSGSGGWNNGSAFGGGANGQAPFILPMPTGVSGGVPTF